MTPPLRWPNGAETLRQQSKTMASDAREEVQRAITVIKVNPQQCETILNYVLYQLASIELALTEAKVGK